MPANPDLNATLTSGTAVRGPVRVLTYSHDSFGLGHLRRSVTLAAAMVARGPHVQALCLTGSPVPDLFELPVRCDLVKLPSIGKDADGAYVARRLPISARAITTLRSDLITATVRSFRPDVLLVDHTASGPGDELLPVLRRLRHENLQTRVVLGMRDVLDAPLAAREELRRTRLFDIVRDFYDHVLVYGDRAVFDPVVEYGFPDDLAERTSFTGPVVPLEARAAVSRRADDGVPHVLVTTGGGEDGYAVLRGAIAALRGPLRGFVCRATVVAGPMLPAEQFAGLQRAVQGDGRIELSRCRADMQALLGTCDAVIGMGGYNTVYECAARGLPLVAVPRMYPRREQLERCRRLAARGVLTLFEAPGVPDAHRLADALRAALAPQPDPRRRLACDGAEQAADLCFGLGRQAGGSSFSQARLGS